MGRASWPWGGLQEIMRTTRTWARTPIVQPTVFYVDYRLCMYVSSEGAIKQRMRLFYLTSIIVGCTSLSRPQPPSVPLLPPLISASAANKSTHNKHRQQPLPPDNQPHPPHRLPYPPIPIPRHHIVITHLPPPSLLPKITRVPRKRGRIPTILIDVPVVTPRGKHGSR